MLQGSNLTVTFGAVVGPPLGLTQVPNLMGKTKAQAQALLQAAHLDGHWAGPHHLALARVSAQSRPAGTTVLRNTTITVTFHLAIGPGPGPGGPIVHLRTVPNVVGLTEAQARAALLAKQLVPSVVRVPSFPPPLRVKTQAPGPGTVVGEGTSVTITIKR